MANSTMTQTRTVVGLFDSRTDAQKAIDELTREGISRNDISMMSSGDTNQFAESSSGTGQLGRGIANTGAAAGGDLGRIAGFTRAGVTAEDARLFEEGIRQGGFLVTVRTTADHTDHVSDVLDRNGAVDIDEKSRGWQTSGRDVRTTSGTDTTSRNFTGDSAKERAMPVVEEKLQVGKRQVGGKRVRVYSEVKEQPVTENVELREEHVHVDRRPADRPATEADMRAFREGSIELSETREEAVVSKEARVVEEVVVSKDVNVRNQPIHDSVRRTEVHVDERNMPAEYDNSHPGYRFGSYYANDPEYRDRDWNTAEPHIRRDWESRGHGAWEDFKDSIRHGWDKIRGRA